MQKWNDTNLEERHEHHRFHTKGNISKVFDGLMDPSSESSTKMIRNISLSYKFVDQDRINGDLQLQEKYFEM